MDYPRTDDDWVKLAECIVTRDPGISPEVVGALSVDATTTIFSWYEGEERRKALVLRQYGRDRLIELGKQTGCLAELGEEPPWMRPREVVEHGSYVIFTNLDTGETKQYYNVNPPDSEEVVSAAMFIKPILEERWDRNIKFDIVPAEKLPAEQPEHIAPDRLLPKTYGDWVDLAEDIKEKYLGDASTRESANKALQHIADEDELADESKRWLVAKLVNWV